MDLSRLRRVRWAVRAVLVLGVAASVAANVLHARPNPISQGIAAWPPLALLLTVELIGRVPVRGRGVTVVRIIATCAIAGIAAWVSYWHMAGVASRYGETGASAYLLPFSVDGLIVVASVCLVELGAQIRDVESGTVPVPAGAVERAGPLVGPSPTPTPTLPGTGPSPATAGAGRPSSGPVRVPAAVMADADGPADRAGTTVPSPSVPVPGTAPAARVSAARTASRTPARTRTAAGQSGDGDGDDLVERARTAAAEHTERTGRRITRDELRAALKVRNNVASELLRVLRDGPRTIQAGTNGHTVVLGGS